MAAKHENRSIDVPTMQKMSAKEYREFLREEELLDRDIEGILRLSPGGNPGGDFQATTRRSDRRGYRQWSRAQMKGKTG